MSNLNNKETVAMMARIAELEAMQAELKALKAKAANTPRLKVSQKGAISVYGLQRMPVTLYAGQWERIIEMVESGVFAAFIEANASELTRKDAKPKSDDAAAAVVAAKVHAAKAQPVAAKKAPAKPSKAKRQPARDIFAD
ncbi:MAG: hypothetical protein VXW99_01835 [Pseudomonadota bacterium]|nr:hypothetical protein [Pseudomonadota bacterium]